MSNLDVVLCHQIPSRSFCYDTACLPVCARCTGMYLGAALGLILPSYATMPYSLGYFLLGLVLNVATVIFDPLDVNWFRAFAGTYFGFGCTLALGLHVARRVDTWRGVVRVHGRLGIAWAVKVFSNRTEHP